MQDNSIGVLSITNGILSELPAIFDNILPVPQLITWGLVGGGGEPQNGSKN